MTSTAVDILRTALRSPVITGTTRVGLERALERLVGKPPTVWPKDPTFRYFAIDSNGSGYFFTHAPQWRPNGAPTDPPRTVHHGHWYATSGLPQQARGTWDVEMPWQAIHVRELA